MSFGLLISFRSGDRSIFNAVCARLGLTVQERDDKRLLLGLALDRMSSAGEVNAHGSRIVGRLTELQLIDPALVFDIAVDSVVETDEHGAIRNHYVMLVGVAAMGLTGSVATLSVSGESPEVTAEREAIERRLEHERLERLAVAHVVAPVLSSDAERLQRQLRLEQSPTALYNAMELIKGEGSIPLTEFASEPTWRTFARSMCHSAAVGDQARHVASKEEPPPEPMRLREAREFINSVALSWLERKAGLGP